MSSYEVFLQENSPFKVASPKFREGGKHKRKGPIRAQVEGFRELKGDFESSLLKD